MPNKQADEDPFADEGHDHSDDHLGEDAPVDRVTVEKLLNATSDAAVQTAWDGLVVPVGQGLGMSDAIDPNGTATPVQDAIDALPTNGGTVLLPPETVVNDGSVHMRSGVSLQGWGYGFTPNFIGSEIHVPDETADIIRFDADQPGIRGCGINGLQLRGPVEDLSSRAPDDQTGVGIRIGDDEKSPSDNPNVARLDVGRIRITRLQNAAMRGEVGSGITECRFENITVERVDAGTANALFDFVDRSGVAAQFGVIGAYPIPDATGANSDIVRLQSGGDVSIRHLNVGGAAGRALSVNTVMGMTTVDQLNYEAVIQTEPADAVVFLGGNSVTNVKSVQLRRGSMERVYRLDNQNWLNLNGNNVLGPINWQTWQSEPWSADGPISIDGDVTHSTVYMGMSEDVVNNTGGELSTPVACMGDMQLVQ